MTNGRILAALLLLAGAVCYGGMIIERLPLEFFFVGSACYAVAGMLFWVARPRPQPAPARTASRATPAPPPLAPTVEMPVPDLSAAERDRVVSRDPMRAAPAEIGIDDPHAMDEDAFEVSSDISLPVEIQDESKLSDQLDKLRRLLESGHLTKDEYQVAKQKLLG